jgi:hypothetical protein
VFKQIHCPAALRAGRRRRLPGGYDPCSLSLIYLPLLLKFYRQVEDT